MTMSMTPHIIDCFPCMDAHAHACASSYIDRHDVIFTFVISFFTNIYSFFINLHKNHTNCQLLIIVGNC